MTRPRTTPNQPEQAGKTWNELEQSRTIKNNPEQMELPNWVQAQDQKLLSNKSISFKILREFWLGTLSRQETIFFFVSAPFWESF